MPRIAFCADVHIANHRRWGGAIASGVNARCALSLTTLQRAVDRAVADRCSAIVVCGDLLDHTRPEPQVLACLQAILSSARRRGCEIALLVGNHDMVSDALGDHALGPLAPVATVVDTPTCVHVGEVDVVAVPFVAAHAGDHMGGWIDAALRSARGKRRVLAAHVGVIDGATPPYLRGAHDAIDVGRLMTICEERGIEAVFVGNWHAAKRWNGDVTVVQCGTLAPAGFDDAGVRGYGGLEVWDAGEVVRHRIAGPRFVVANSVAELVGEVSRARADTVFVSYRGGEPREAVAPTLAGLKARGVALGGVEYVDKEGKQEAAAARQEAAAEARSAAGSLPSALSGFVASMPMPLGVDRQAVEVEAASALREGGGLG